MWRKRAWKDFKLHSSNLSSFIIWGCRSGFVLNTKIWLLEVDRRFQIIVKKLTLSCLWVTRRGADGNDFIHAHRNHYDWQIAVISIWVRRCLLTLPSLEKIERATACSAGLLLCSQLWRALFIITQNPLIMREQFRSPLGLRSLFTELIFSLPGQLLLRTSTFA